MLIKYDIVNDILILKGEKIMKKHTFRLVFLLISLLSLSGCNSQPSNSDEPSLHPSVDTSVEPSSKPTIIPSTSEDVKDELLETYKELVIKTRFLMIKIAKSIIPLH